ncbi:MAG: hypothetical protein PHU25_20400 [Deltaproteobacteria bacterium]|nr:hypothetical protein [Deltaproteobacteria bacterium]
MRSCVLCALLLPLGCAPKPEGSAEGECADGRDNDRNGLVDCEEAACAGVLSCEEQAAKAREAEAAAAGAGAAATEEQRRKREQRDAFDKAAREGVFELSGLMVQHGHNGKDIDFANAQKYCEGLSLNGRDDWRLPSADEAMAIARSRLVPPEDMVMWTKTPKGKNLAVIVGNTSAAMNELGVKYDGECRARCVRALP